MSAKLRRLISEKRYDQAKQLCDKILSGSPQNADVLAIKGKLHYFEGDFIQALSYLKLSLIINPVSVEHLCDYGLVSLQLGDSRQALNAFAKAYKIDTSNAKPILHMAEVNIAEENWGAGLEFLAMYIEINPEDLEAQKKYAQIIRYVQLDEFKSIHKNAIYQCLINENVNTKYLFDVWLFFIKNELDFTSLEQVNSYSALSLIKPVLLDSFFILGIRRLRLRSLKFEKFLSVVRGCLLQKLSEGDARVANEFKYLLNALAIQCWNNEYIFSFDENEIELCKNIEKKIVIEKDYSEALVYIIACYYPVVDTFANIDLSALNDSSEFRNFYKILVTEPLLERGIAQSIGRMTDINDAVSSEVQSQYEENPYPRWKYIESENETVISEDNLDILHAGCGTGQQIIPFLKKYPNARHIGVDLSRSSLSYAMREIENEGINNLNLYQGDILQLDEDENSYDLIICTGVLHHLEKPEQGLKVLKNKLKPQGTARIALYSEMGRIDIVKAQDFIREGNYPTTAMGIRKFRNDVFELLQNDKCPEFIKNLVVRPDFYTMSECRDLLFHVKEHRYNIPEILSMLDSCELQFVQLNLSNNVTLSSFKKEYPNKNDFFDLMKWHAFEQSHRYAFASMYDFTVKHKV